MSPRTDIAVNIIVIIIVCLQMVILIAGLFGVGLFVEWRDAEDLGKHSSCFMIIKLLIS